jgi:ArsR family transcriptional regulator
MDIYFHISGNMIDSRRAQRYRSLMQIERTAEQLEALGNATRLKVYRALVRAGDSGMPVGRLQDRLGIPASTLSHHLRRLIQTGLVSQDRQATTLICRANYPAMRKLIGFLVDECCADSGCATAEKSEAA